MIKSFNGKTPKIAESAFVAETAVIIGDVEVGEHASIWYNAVLRGDVNKITIGAYSNVQDNVTVHVDENYPVNVRQYVSVGHNAVIHGATIGDCSLVGMGAVMLNGSKVGNNSLLAAGALLTENKVLPDGCMGKGIVKEWRELDADAIAGIKRNATAYVKEADKFKNA